MARIENRGHEALAKWKGKKHFSRNEKRTIGCVAFVYGWIGRDLKFIDACRIYRMIKPSVFLIYADFTLARTISLVPILTLMVLMS